MSKAEVVELAGVTGSKVRGEHGRSNEEGAIVGRLTKDRNDRVVVPDFVGEELEGMSLLNRILNRTSSYLIASE
jgi:hypothetical protein